MKRTRILLGALFLLGMSNAQAQQSCANCQNLAPTGDMSQITTSGQGYLNTMGTDWHASHGSPSYSPGSLWMWSYNNYGEGVYFEGFTFTAGHTYCITFDTYTRTHDNSAPNPTAGFRVVGTSSMVPFESTSGGDPIPPIPGASDIVADVNWSTVPMNGWSTFSFNYTPSGNWSQLWFYPYSATLPQCELTLQNLRICDITVTNPCEFDFNFEITQRAGCQFNFTPYISFAPGLTVLQYLWNFGDGTTSTESNPTHYYDNPGYYSTTLTLLVVNENGECCVKSVKQGLNAEPCDPCAIAESTKFKYVRPSTYQFDFSATSPNTPNYVYLWNFGDGTTATGHDVSHTYAANGTYVVELRTYYFDANQGVCCSAVYTRIIRIKGGIIIDPIDPTDPVDPIDPTIPVPIGGGKPAGHTDIPEELKERPAVSVTENIIKVYPNPTSGIFTVTATTQNIVEVRVTDASGRIITTVKGDKKSATVSLQNQKTGTYSLSIELENGNKLTESIVKN